VRDGERALELARAAFEADRSLASAEAVAMAFAELGRFAEAAEWQRRIVAGAEETGGSDLLARARAHLESYERDEPIRQ
jgi:hypothetical protein